MTYTGYYGGDVGNLFDSSGNYLGSSYVDEWGNVYQSPGIMDYPNNLLAGWDDALSRAIGISNPGGVGLVPISNDIFGSGNYIDHIFGSPDINYLLGASSQGSIDNMLNGLGIGGF